MKAFQWPNEWPRSRLYSLVPCEVGTLWTECFTSYLNRLGWTHHVSPRAMVVQEVMPYLNKTQALSRQWIGSLSRGYAMSMNGVGTPALEWVEALSHLTMRPVSNVNYLGPPYGNYFCRFLSLDLRRFLLKLSMMVGLGSTIALDLHHIQNDGVMDDAIYCRHRRHRVFEDLV